MSWITFLWSLNAGICLALAGVHLLVWAKSRESWAYLLFAIATLASASAAVFEQVLMRAQSVEQFGNLLRWYHVPVGVIVVSLIWFVRLYLKSGPVWLAWLVTGLRIAVLILTFSMQPNLNFREITGLRAISAWGETVVVAVGEKNPWTNITHLSALLVLVFVIMASFQAWRRGDRRRARVVGSSFGAAFVGGLIISELLNRGLLPVPMTVSFLFLIILSGIAYELSYDLIRAGHLTRDLRLSEARLTQATREADIGIWEWDVARDEIWASDSIRARVGLEGRERFTLEELLRGLHPEDRDRARTTVLRAVDDRREFQLEYRILADGGEIRWIAARGRVDPGLEGRELRLRGVSIDITERKRADALLERQRAELAHAVRLGMLGELVAGLAHELNHPLGAILSNAQAAKRFLAAGRLDEAEIGAVLDDIVRDDKRAAAVIHHLRALLRKEPMERRSCALNEIIRDGLQLLNGELAMHEVTLRCDLAEGLPMVVVSRVEMQQVLINLVMNAIEAMPQTPPAERVVTVRTFLSGDHAAMEVSDRGRGIREAEMARVFESFVTTRAAGMGMGLAICRSIMVAHGGEIYAAHNPAGGAQFTCLLPMASLEEGPSDV